MKYTIVNYSIINNITQLLHKPKLFSSIISYKYLFSHFSIYYTRKFLLKNFMKFQKFIYSTHVHSKNRNPLDNSKQPSSIYFYTTLYANAAINDRRSASMQFSQSSRIIKRLCFLRDETVFCNCAIDERGGVLHRISMQLEGHLLCQ